MSQSQSTSSIVLIGGSAEAARSKPRLRSDHSTLEIREKALYMHDKLKTPFRELTAEQQLQRIYFACLSLQGFSAFKMHKAIGLWEKKSGVGEQVSWRNVSEHCLVEMARVKALAKVLVLSEELQKDLLGAAAIHDFYKEQEIKIIKTEGASWASFAKASEQAIEIMKNVGFRERVIWLANAVGHGSLQETVQILHEERLSEDNVAFLVMHFVDDTTREAAWAKPTIRLDDSRIINELDRRMEKNEGNLLYRQLNEEGRSIFKDETTPQAQRRIGHLVENRLAHLIYERTNQKIHPRYLPDFVDGCVRAAISSVRHKQM